MRKFITLIVLMCSIQIQSYAQGNQIEAKAAYLLAEESFAKGDYEETLNYLKSAAKNLGATNSKLLYLQVQTELELYKKDSSYYEQVIKTISEFQNSADVGSFAEEKVVDIAKTKMQLIQHRQNEIKNKLEDDKRKAEYDSIFQNYSFNNWPFGVSIDQLRVSHKDSQFFKKKTKQAKEENTGLAVPTTILHYPAGIMLQGWENSILFPVNMLYFDDIYGIITDNNNIVKGYRQAIYWQYYKNKDKITQQQSLDDIQEMVKSLSDHFGQEAQFTEVPMHKYLVRGIYRWASGKKVVSFYTSIYLQNNGYWITRVVQEIVEK
jgi:hypothetical protein